MSMGRNLTTGQRILVGNENQISTREQRQEITASTIQGEGSTQEAKQGCITDQTD